MDTQCAFGRGCLRVYVWERHCSWANHKVKNAISFQQQCFAFLKLFCYCVFNNKFSVFSKISGIQTDFQPSFRQHLCHLTAGVWPFCVGSVHCSLNPQVLFSAKNNLKTKPTILFTHLKIISLQCFQFSIFNNKQYLNRPLV